jgi:hypothetical protein
MKKGCLCEGNKDLKNLERVRSIAEKAAKMEDFAFIIYKNEDTYYFCKEGENFQGEMVELVLP